MLAFKQRQFLKEQRIEFLTCPRVKEVSNAWKSQVTGRQHTQISQLASAADEAWITTHFFVAIIAKLTINYITFVLSTRMKPHVSNMDDNEVKRDPWTKMILTIDYHVVYISSSWLAGLWLFFCLRKFMKLVSMNVRGFGRSWLL